MTEPANWPAYFFAILGGALLVLNFVKGISRKPPIEAEFATKAELKEGLSASRSEFIGEALAHGKLEWTAEQEAEFDRRLEEAFAGAGHWRKGTERTEGTKGTP